MARTIAKLTGHGTGSSILGDIRARMIEVDISSYTTGGESFTTAEAGLTSMFAVMAEGIVPTTAANRDSQLVWDRTNAKLFAIVVSTGLEVASTTNLGKYQVICLGY